MTKQQKRLNVIKYLLSEQPQYSEIEIPAGEQEQKSCFVRFLIFVCRCL